MNLVEKVKKNINEIGLPFIYFDFLRVNNELDFTELPCVVCVRNPNSQLINAAGNFCEETDFLLFFVDKTYFDYNSFENEQIIEKMKREAIKFIRHVKKGSDLMFTTAHQIKKVYDYMDMNVTGCGLQTTIRETKGECLNLSDNENCNCSNS